MTRATRVSEGARGNRLSPVRLPGWISAVVPKPRLSKINYHGELIFRMDADTRTKDARSVGEALVGPLSELWRYRVGDYRLICEIRDNELLVLVVHVGNRRDFHRGCGYASRRNPQCGDVEFVARTVFFHPQHFHRRIEQ